MSILDLLSHSGHELNSISTIFAFVRDIERKMQTIDNYNFISQEKTWHDFISFFSRHSHIGSGTKQHFSINAYFSIKIKTFKKSFSTWESTLKIGSIEHGEQANLFLTKIKEQVWGEGVISASFIPKIKSTKNCT